MIGRRTLFKRIVGLLAAGTVAKKLDFSKSLAKPPTPLDKGYQESYEANKLPERGRLFVTGVSKGIRIEYVEGQAYWVSGICREKFSEEQVKRYNSFERYTN